MKLIVKIRSHFVLISVALSIIFPFFFVENIIAQTNSTDDMLVPSLKLLGSGARWAAGQGDSALYVNWKDNWLAHHLTDGQDWYWEAWTNYMDDFRTSITKALEYANFSIDYTGDIPQSLEKYDLVLIHAWFAVEPHHASLIRDYVADGGAVVILSAVPCYFSVYCKDNWPYRLASGSSWPYEGWPYSTEGFDITSIKEWLGASGFWNTGGSASIVDDNPFNTSLLANEVIFSTTSTSKYFVYSLSFDSQIIAKWNSNQVFAFTHEYGKGRVYYQACFELDADEDTLNSVSFIVDPKLGLQPTEGLSQTTVQGSGFAPNSEITVTWNGTTMYTIPNPVLTDDHGNFTAIISVLNQTEMGQYQIRAVDEMKNEAHAKFTVIPEFPSWIILILGLFAVSVLSIAYRYKFKYER